jgi:hypothetical protein
VVLEVNNEGPIWPNTVSFGLENNGAKLTMKESRSQSAPRLSLVPETALTPGNFSPLTHSHLLQGIRVRVKQERPVAWTDSLARFRTHLH